MVTFLAPCAVACVPTDPIPEADQRLLVEAVLRAGSSNQVIVLRSIGGSLGVSDEPVIGALVSVRTPDGSEALASEVPSAPGLYVLDFTTPIGAGATYALRIVTRSGEEVTGTTNVPDGVPVSSDYGISEFSRANDTLRAALPRVPGAESYYIGVNAALSYAPGYAELRYWAFTDTSVALHGTIELFDGDPVFTPFDTVTVVAGAVDANFYTYYHTKVDPFAGTPPSRLQGALGVFGSFVPLYHRRFAVVP